MIIFNWIAVLLVLPGIVLGALAAGLFLGYESVSAGVFVAVFALVTGALDILVRAKGDSESSLVSRFFVPGSGGHVFFLPLWLCGAVLFNLLILRAVWPTSGAGHDQALSPVETRRVSLSGVRLGATYEESARWGPVQRPTGKSPRSAEAEDYGPFSTFVLGSQSDRDGEAWRVTALVGGHPEFNGRDLSLDGAGRFTVEATLGKPEQKISSELGDLWIYPVDLAHPVEVAGRRQASGQLLIAFVHGRATVFSMMLEGIVPDKAGADEVSSGAASGRP